MHEAKKLGYRSRAAFKLQEIQKKYKLFKKGQHILDLGAAPGSWSQVVLEYIAPTTTQITAIDLLPIEPLNHVNCIQADFRDLTYEMYDGIISDVAPSSTGFGQIDHLKLEGMIEEMIPIIEKSLKKNGFFICKVFKGGKYNQFFKQSFEKVVTIKPKASRPESREEYIVCMGFKH